MTLRFHAEARAEIDQSVTYYAERDPVVARRFLAALDHSTR